MSDEYEGETPIEAIQKAIEAYVDHSGEENELAQRWAEHLDGLEETRVPEDLADDTLDAFEEGLEKLFE